MVQEPLYFQVEKKGYKIEARCQQMGRDYLLCIWGGAAHIGAVAMAQPRKSLQDSDKQSATASVFCYVGHKEDQLVKDISEKLSTTLKVKVVVAAGLHWDNLSSNGVKQVLSNINELVDMIVLELL